MRGDANDDGAIDIGDAISVLNYIFASAEAPKCLKAADTNDDGAIDIGDPISLLNYIFASGESPKPPFPSPGEDPTPDELTCGLVIPTPEEAILKLKENYSQITDFTADLVLSSTLDNQPFSSDEYCRFYFLASDKEKVESFSDDSRTTISEITITDGPKLYLLEPLNKLKEEMSLSEAAAISGETFENMDICYHPDKFLASHTITASNQPADEGMIILDAVPKAANNLYTRLELYIDYEKGIVGRSNLYDKDGNLVQMSDVLASRRMPNGAWLPTKTKKTSMSNQGILAETATYTNIRLNTGLTQEDFNPDAQ